MSKKFDQRAVAFVEVHGTQVDFNLFEHALEQREWPVLKKESGRASMIVESVSRYTIEARFRGSRWNSTKGARERIEVLGDELTLDMQVKVTDRVTRDPRDLPSWLAYERPDLDQTGMPRSRMRNLLHSWKRWRAETLGSSDTGRLVLATSATSAQALGTMRLPGARVPDGQVAVRRPAGNPNPPRPATGTHRESTALFKWTFMSLGLGVVAGGAAQATGSLWAFFLAGFLTFAALASALRRQISEISVPVNLATSVSLGIIATTAGAQIVRTEPSDGLGMAFFTISIAAGLVFNGIRLLARQWTWQRTAPWLIPVLAPLLLSFFPSLGLSLHAAYLDAYNLDIESIEISMPHQIVASLKLTFYMSFLLIALATLGYMKHFHWHVKDRWFGNSMMFVVSVMLLIMGVFEQAIFPASDAGYRAIAMAEQGKAPPPYFGISPTWVCANPIRKVETTPSTGAEFNPDRPYIHVGEARDKATLWDAQEKHSLTLPTSHVRITPAPQNLNSCA